MQIISYEILSQASVRLASYFNILDRVITLSLWVRLELFPVDRVDLHVPIGTISDRL